LIKEHRIPGAQLSVLQGDEVLDVAAGVLSLRTGQPATTDALFLPGSIGKTYTATVVMSLVDEGKLELDRPVRDYLPDFATADAEASASVTIRHLLTHTSGFDGDRFDDTGRGDDALARYVDSCRTLPQICDPGKIWSYSNAGYGILGRVVEVVTGDVWETALRDRLLTPLGLQHTVVFPEEALVHPVSVGHVANPENPEQLMVSPQWGLWRSTGPMGASLVASAGDVMEFFRMHLRGGVAADGTRILKKATVDAMKVEQVKLLETTLGEGWGLGWILDHWGGVALIGHDGNSLGQNAFARVAPEANFGFVLQTNVESAMGLYRELAAWLFGEQLGVGPHPTPVAGDDPVPDAARYTGLYTREGVDIEVKPGPEGRLLASVVVSRDDASTEGLPPMDDLPLPHVSDDTFMLKVPIADEPLATVFFNPHDVGGRPSYLHFGGRASRRRD
jgi:CubicO group peptidase (beta-lactamase class C family)